MQLLDITEPEIKASYRAFGIDLGTTNSLVAMVDDKGEVVIFKDADGKYLVSSAVEYRGSEIKVGHEVDPSAALSSVKRLMGKSVKDVEDLFLGVPLKEGEDGSIFFDVAGHGAVTPIEVAAEILRKLSVVVKESIGEEIKRAVVTVPAYFDEVARKATRDAARMAGIEVLRLLSEPTAAALAYKIEHTNKANTCVVYDCGGGTFDVSVLRLHEGVFQVLATGGDTWLGGDDIDRSLAELVMRKYRNTKDSSDVDCSLSKDLLFDARCAKVLLSNGKTGDFVFKIGGTTFSCDISSTEFSSIVDEFVDKTIRILRDTISAAGVEFSDISKVILVGGSAKLPQVKLALDDIFPGKVCDDVDPELAVVTGAALQAHYLSNPVSGDGKVIIDVVPLSLSLEIMGGISETIIPRNTPVPAFAAQEFTTCVDGQTFINVHVCQGEREIASENRSLARFDLEVLPLPAGEARVRVEFRVDTDGLLTISAQDKLIGQEKLVEVHSLKDVTDAEIKEQVYSSVEHFEADMISKELRSEKLECSRVVFSLQKMLDNNKIVSDTDVTKARIALSEAEGVMAEGDIERVRTFVQKLKREFADL